MTGFREDWFPTCVWYFDEPECLALNGSLAAAIQAERADDATGLVRSNLRGWHSRDDLQQRAEFASLFEHVGRCVEEVVEFERWDRSRTNPRVSNAWANVNPPGASNSMHNHPNSVLSGAYYVVAPEQSGDLVFRDPREQAAMLVPPLCEFTPRTFRSVRYPPREGRLLIFPAWLLHGVEPNGSDQERVAISFNVTA